MVKKHSDHIVPYNPNKDVRMAMQGDFECLLDTDGFKHIDIQIQRRHERYRRISEFKDSNLRPDLIMKIETIRKYTRTETTRRSIGWIKRKTALDSE